MTQLELLPGFDGSSFDFALDGKRLASQLERVKSLMMTGRWFTLAELHRAIGGSEAGISARVRDLRKTKFGNYSIERRRVTETSGQWEYRMIRYKAKGPTD